MPHLHTRTEKHLWYVDLQEATFLGSQKPRAPSLASVLMQRLSLASPPEFLNPNGKLFQEFDIGGAPQSRNP